MMVCPITGKVINRQVAASSIPEYILICFSFTAGTVFLITLTIRKFRIQCVVLFSTVIKIPVPHAGFFSLTLVNLHIFKQQRYSERLKCERFYQCGNTQGAQDTNVRFLHKPGGKGGGRVERIQSGKYILITDMVHFSGSIPHNGIHK